MVMTAERLLQEVLDAWQRWYPMTNPIPTTEAGRRLFTDNEPMDMLESNGVTWGDILAIEDEARAQGDEYKEATDAAMNYGDGYAAGQVEARALREAALNLVDYLTPLGFPSGRALMYDSPPVERLRAALARHGADRG